VSDDRPTRRDLMKPVQLLGLAFGAALFAGVVTLVSMGFFQNDGTGQERQAALVLALIIAGVSFIAVLVIVALLLLAIDPAQITKTIDRPVLLDGDDEDTDAAASDDTPKP
jgi:energy-coupling factor transporter transmembrane protein EcfT